MDNNNNDDNEQITAALRQVFAEIINEQSKEAARRIMVAERKASESEEQVSSYKKKALDMLVRIKRMMDSQAAEAQTAISIQTSRIEELEAQLQEAKNNQENLKTELEKVHIELAEVKNDSVKPVNEQKEEWTGSAMLPLASSRDGPLSPLLGRRYTGDSRSSIQESFTQQSVQFRDSSENYDSTANLASIVKKTKDPELYTNVCTRRMRASERSVTSGNMPNLVAADYHFSGTKNEQITKKKGATKGSCNIAKLENIDLSKRSKSSVKDLVGCQEVLPLQFSPSLLRKRTTVYRKAGSASSTQHDRKSLRQCKICNSSTNLCLSCELFTSSHKSDASISSKIGDSRQDLSKSTEQKEVKTTASNFISSSPTKSDESVSNRVAKSFQVPDCLSPNQARPSSVDTDCKYNKKCEMTKDDDDKPLKYTFTRKRKRETFTSLVKCESLENKSGEKRSSDPEMQKSNLLAGSSPDSSVEEAATQLMSLSRGKW